MEELAGAASVAPIAYALVEVAKRTGLPDRFAAVGAIVAGVLVAFLFGLGAVYNLTVDNPFTLGAIGLVGGLTASGAYSGYKALKEG
jgi:hypothetical protein